MPDPNAPAPGANEGDRQYITKEDLAAAFKDFLTTGLNPAITGHQARLEKKWEARFAALAPKPVEKVEEGGEDVETDPAKPKTEAQARAVAATTNPELDALRKQVETLTRRQQETVKAQKDAEAKAAQAERRRVEDAGYAALRSALTDKVVKGAERLAIADLRDRGAVHITETGDVRLRLRSTPDEPEEGLPLDDGLGLYLKSPEAKFLIPAPTQVQQPVRRPLLGGQRPALTTKSPVESFEAKTGKTVDSLL